MARTQLQGRASLMLLALLTIFVCSGGVSSTNAEQAPLLWQFDIEPPGTLRRFVIGTLFDGPTGWRVGESLHQTEPTARRRC